MSQEKRNTTSTKYYLIPIILITILSACSGDSAPMFEKKSPLPNFVIKYHHLNK
jgi:hypothetical protein